MSLSQAMSHEQHVWGNLQAVDVVNTVTGLGKWSGDHVGIPKYETQLACVHAISTVKAALVTAFAIDFSFIAVENS